jgi:hypothetical protein
VLVSGDINGNAVANVVVSNNVATGDSVFGYSYNSTVCTNIIFTKNTGSRLNNLAVNGSWFTDAGDNNFAFWNENSGTLTNMIDYQTATRFQTQYFDNNGVYYLSTTDCVGHCVPGSTLTVSNASVNGYTFSLYYQSDSGNNPIGTPLTMPYGAQAVFYWTGTAWTTNVNWHNLILDTQAYGLKMSGLFIK